jgi:effector-binding domain-containing protein
MHCDSAKDLWDKLQNIYEGDAKVKGAKLQIFRAKFEQLKMKQDEDIATYLLRVDEIVNTIKGLGVEVHESMVVQNVLRSLPMRFDPKISTLEERADLGTLSMDELHGIFTTYEMRTEKENPVTKEATFKASKKTNKKNKKKSKPGCSCSDHSDEDEEMDNFIRKLKKGINKYKCKLPLNFFNCCGIGHFASKCPHKNKDNDEEEASKREKKYQKGNMRINKRKFFKKSFYSKEDSSSSNEEDNDSDNNSEKILFMAVGDDHEEEGEVDLRAELISALE